VTQRRPVVEPLASVDEPSREANGNRERATRGHTNSTGTSSLAPFGVDVAVPIITDGPWGVLVARLPALVSGDETVGWLEAAAALLASSVHSAGRLDLAAREVQRDEALLRVAMDTNGSLDLDETMTRVVDHAMLLF